MPAPSIVSQMSEARRRGSTFAGCSVSLTGTRAPGGAQHLRSYWCLVYQSHSRSVSPDARIWAATPRPT